MKVSLEHILTLIYHYFTRLDRVGMVWWIGVAYTLLLLVTAFGYTVFDHEFYAKKAYEQQTMILKNPTSRGSIYSSEDSLHGVLSVSTNLGNLAIDPSQSGSRDKLLSFLSDIVFDEYCQNNSENCLSNMGKYLREDFSSQKSITVTDVKAKIRTYIGTKMDTPIESVEVAESLDDPTIDRIASWRDESLFFSTNNLYVNPTKVKDAAGLAAKLSIELKIETAKILPKFEIRKKRHLEIIRKMSVSTRDAVTKRMNEERISVKSKQITEDEAIYPFIKIEDNLVRFYPEQGIAGQITGFVDGEGNGKYGIEGYFQDILQSESPTQKVTKDSAGRPIGGYLSRDFISLKTGVDVTLTIDRNIQKQISSMLEKAVKDFRANKGSVIVMDPKTGAVIAMANYPDYDPNSFTDVYEMERVSYARYANPYFELFGVRMFVEDSASGDLLGNIDGVRMKLREASDDEIQNGIIPKYKYKNNYGASVYSNDVVSALYEPGSVFKSITTAIGIDSGEIEPNDTYYDKGYVEIDYGTHKQRIKNLSNKCLGRHTYINAINWSCNVGMIDIIEKVGPSLFYKYVHDFGFGMKTNITLDGEQYAQISPYEKWSRTQFFTMSFGQGINVSMLQMAAAYSVLANGGVYMEPYIVESLMYADGRKVENVPTPLRRVIKEETAKKITAMLVDSVKNGFAAKGGVPGYIVAGKTGTSQIPYRGTYENLYLRSDLGHTITSYGGYAPANNPKFVLIVSLNRPRTSIYSETTSSELFSHIAQYLLEYYKVPKNTN